MRNFSASDPLAADFTDGSDVRILVVDDNEDFLQAIAEFLRQHSFPHVHLARGGKEALELTGKHRPGIVLLDVRMPDLNGLEVSRQLKAAPEPPRIILCTSADASLYKEVARAAGADALISKSLLGVRLVALIRSLIETHALAKRSSAEPPRPPGSAEASASLRPRPPFTPLS